MTKNTPTPWMISGVNDKAVVAFDENGTREVVAQFLSPSDTAFVIRAVNSHEALVTALRELLELCDADASFENRDIEPYNYDAIVNDVMGQARAALTLSGAEK